MTPNAPKPINRIAKHFGEGNDPIPPIAREDYVGKIVFVEPPLATPGAGEYIIVDQTDNALYGVRLGSACDGHEVKLIPLAGPTAWTVVRAEPDTYGLAESTILMLSEFAATRPEDRRENLDHCVYESAEYTAGALLRMLERRQQHRCESVIHKLERIGQDTESRSNEKQATAASPTPSAAGSGTDDTKLTASAAADSNPTPVLLINLNNFSIDLAWLV